MILSKGPVISYEEQGGDYKNGRGRKGCSHAECGGGGTTGFGFSTKREAEKVLGMMKGRGTISFGVVLTEKLEALAILEEGGTKKCIPLKSGDERFYIVFKGMQKVPVPRCSHFIAPPSPARK